MKLLNPSIVRRHLARNLSGITLTLLFATLVGGILFPPQKASALLLNTQDRYQFADKSTIVVYTTNGQIKFVDPNPNDSFYQFFYTDSCGANMITIPTLNQTASSNLAGGVGYDNAAKCAKQVIDVADTTPISVKGTFSTLPTAGAGGDPLVAQAATAKESLTKCEDQGGLAWITCPVVSTIDALTSFFDSQVQGYLMVDTSNFDNKELKGAWATIRNIALLILVPIMLVMVIGTAMEVGPFDAYTVRKAMPRMLAAVLFIVLSYSICTYAVEITNAMGTGILGLLTSAVGQDGPITLDTITGGTTSTIGQWTGIIVGAGAIVVAGWAGALTFGIVFSFGLVTVLALFIGYIILVLRQIIILGLIMFAPLAILSWIFPGNDKIWGMWKTSFTRLLLMFPLITALIGVGRVFAFIVNIKS